jgi:Ni/Fe-hydrogenase subunit HybB-like protein
MAIQTADARFKITPFQIFLAVLATIIFVGVIAGLIVLTQGLSVTNLNDLVPWGLWITIDLSAIALSAGAFLLCAAVYILRLKQFQPVARTATFVGLIGYSMAMLCLLMDIGRPDRFWHALIYWNPHSVLWEVTMCVILYFSVLVVETIPIIGHSELVRSRWPGLAQRMMSFHKLAPILAVMGLSFSMLHQSSLGATYGVLKARPIWFRPNLSVLFMASAIAAGPALTVLVSMLAARLAPKYANVEDTLLERISFFIGWVLVGYLYFRFWDTFAMTYTVLPGRNEGLQMITKGSLSFNFWAGEILLGIVVPMIILLTKRFRENRVLRMFALALVVGGLVAYRWDTNMAGQLVLLSYLPDDITARFTTYFPSLIEILAGAGVVAYGVMAITLGVRYLGIVDHSQVHEEDEHSVELQPVAAATD